MGYPILVFAYVPLGPRYRIRTITVVATASGSSGSRLRDRPTLTLDTLDQNPEPQTLSYTQPQAFVAQR